MGSLRHFASVLALCALAACVQTAPPVQSLAGAPEGKFSFVSANPYDFRELLEKKNSPEVVEGTLVLPQRSGRVPVVVFLHGSGGLQPWQFRYADLFKAQGWGTFLIDSFRTRSVSSVIDEQISVTEQQMAADAFAALALLRTHPRVDPDRIAVMGQSKGAMVAMGAANQTIIRWLLADQKGFAAHVAMYPFCGFTAPGAYTSDPVLIQAGQSDNYTPIQQCRDFVATARAAGMKAEFVEHAGAHHGWDGNSVLRYMANAVNPSNCAFDIRANGDTVLRGTDRVLEGKFSRGSALRTCARGGAMIGSDSATREKSDAVLIVFLKKALD